MATPHPRRAQPPDRHTQPAHPAVRSAAAAARIARLPLLSHYSTRSTASRTQKPRAYMLPLPSPGQVLWLLLGFWHHLLPLRPPPHRQRRGLARGLVQPAGACTLAGASSSSHATQAARASSLPPPVRRSAIRRCSSTATAAGRATAGSLSQRTRTWRTRAFPTRRAKTTRCAGLREAPCLVGPQSHSRDTLCPLCRRRTLSSASPTARAAASVSRALQREAKR